MLSRKGLVFRLINASAFRYTLLFFVIFLVAVTGIGFVVFKSILDTTMRRIDREMIAEFAYLDELRARTDPNNPSVLANEVARLQLIRRDALYAVFIGEDHQVLTTDFRTLPAEGLTAEGMFRFTYTSNTVNKASGEVVGVDRPAVGRRREYIYTRYDGENVPLTVFTARDISEIDQITAAAQKIALRVLLVAPILAILLGLAFTSFILRRVERIGQTVRAIRDGDLSKRIALTGSNDEFDTLSDNINAMLNQIERLMTGMRQVSDNIAHDLRSPLTRIKARLDRVLQESDPNTQEVLEQTAVDVERLLATFNALLSITRIEAGESGGTTTLVDLKAVAEEMLDLYEPAASEEGFILVGNINPTPLIRGTRELISQAIANLLDNAFKYARHPDRPDLTPTIELTVSPKVGGGALLSVMDNGPGVSESDRERILQRFVRLEQSRSTTGNGLGLSLVAAIARRHNASISVGRGLMHSRDGRALATDRDYGLAVRLAFPPPPKPSKSTLGINASRNASLQLKKMDTPNN
ncbi:sensor histidine kinase [Parvularcula bermudensis]|uniref:sensor histidine kinase n=1 Tax=Parvularcula bermudensis TaxID=208216 RepID=UPI0013053C10|nr:HAMP domain-containing sensor histidine kinase [Parvularcula bermudensis]